MLIMNSITIEVIKNKKCILKDDKIILKCEEFLKSIEVYPGTTIYKINEDLQDEIHHIIIDELEGVNKLDFTNLNLKWFIYTLNEFGGQIDYFQNENDNEFVNLSTNWVLPSKDFDGSWENLIYDMRIKQDLLKYVSTMMVFADKGVDSNIVCSNRVILLHGPPGTGKTSLCKALAHKLAARLKHRYTCGQLIEINSHSLFSKWFSESGKLVTKMFSKIHELIDNPRMFICVLIDEVESLAHARTQSISGNEPSDAIRVVNAVLTQIDQIKRFPNVLILTTSNMTQAIDLAFVDRADIKQFIGLPSVYAIYQIYYTCIQELMRTGIISANDIILPVNSMKIVDLEKNCVCKHSKELMRICELSDGFSGRTLRKVPFIAHALFAPTSSMSLDTFLECMVQAVEYLKSEKKYFENF